MFEQVKVNSERWFDLTPLKNEEFRDIKGYEGLYQVSNYGRVKSLRRKVRSGIKNSEFIIVREKIIRFGIDGKKYLDAHLSKNCKIKVIKVHILVAQAFINKKDFKYMPDENIQQIDLNKLEVNHKDEIPSNNNVDNLEWCTKKYNINYGTRNKRSSKKRYKRIIQKDLNGNIIKIWKSISEASNKLNINLSTISKCCNKNYYSKTSHSFIWEYLEGND